MAATVKFLEADGVTIPPSTVDLGHAVAGNNQTPRKFGLESTASRVLGASPFNGSELQRFAHGTNDGVDQLRIGLDTATLSAPYGVAAVLGPTADGGTWSGTGNIFHRITAQNATGETIGSTEVSTNVNDTTKRITLTWTQTPGATGYRVWRSTTSGTYGPTALRTTIVGGGTVTFIDNGAALSSGTIPTANTSGGWLVSPTLGATADGGVWSGTGVKFWRVVAIDATAVQLAASLEASINVDDTTKRVTLTWPAVTGAAGYLVYRSVTSEVYLAALRTTLGAVTSFIDNGAATGAGDHTDGPSYGSPPTLDLPPLSLGEIAIGEQVFFWVNRVIPGATAEAGNDRIAFVKFAEL
jgi:hypothetical protein